MKKSLAIGRRIVEVRQHRMTSNAGQSVWSIDSILLDNGTCLVFNVVETESLDYAIDAFVIKVTNK